VPAYQAGSLRQVTVRLTNVQTYAGASMVADYRLAYAQGTSTGRSQLTSVTLCDGGGTCLPATTFAWQNGTTNVTVTSNVAGQDGTLSGYRPYVGDFNGDGIADVMWDGEQASYAISVGTRVLWAGTGTSFTVTSNFAGQNGQITDKGPTVADFNRDGRSDVWWSGPSRVGSPVPITEGMSTNSSTFTVASGPAAPFEWATLIALTMDINGDGRADMTWAGSNNLTMWLTNADGTVTVPADVTGCSSFPGWSP
jgi:hypothetical protein